jgi:hypothetical protein
MGAATLVFVLYLLTRLNAWVVGGTTVAVFFALLSISHRNLFADFRSLVARPR